MPNAEKMMMACGHSANATHEGKPCCAICIGLNDDAERVIEAPDLNGRMATCSCGKKAPSSTSLPFFEHCPTKEQDLYYCGCRGWN